MNNAMIDKIYNFVSSKCRNTLSFQIRALSYVKQKGATKEGQAYTDISSKMALQC